MTIRVKEKLYYLHFETSSYGTLNALSRKKRMSCFKFLNIICYSFAVFNWFIRGYINLLSLSYVMFVFEPHSIYLMSALLMLYTYVVIFIWKNTSMYSI